MCVWSVACPAGLYGVSCSQTCVCHNHSSCDAVSGQCVCSAGWTGDTCAQRKILTLHSLLCFIYTVYGPFYRIPQPKNTFKKHFCLLISFNYLLKPTMIFQKLVSLIYIYIIIIYWVLSIGRGLSRTLTPKLQLMKKILK